MKPIDGDDMLRRVNFLLTKITTPDFVEILMALKEYLEKAPTLTLDDLRPKGRWVDGVCNRCVFDAMYYKDNSAQVYTDICPSCGADMRGGGEDA